MTQRNALKEFAREVGLTLAISADKHGVTYQLKEFGEPICTDHEPDECAKSIEAYKGSHPKYRDAQAQYAYMTRPAKEATA